LIQAADLAGFRGAPFSDQVTEAAAESIRTQCEWHIAPSVEATVKIRASGNVLLLPSLHVTAVASVVDSTGNAVTDWEWYPSGIIERAAAFPAFVTVTFTHGYTSCPKELLPIIAERAVSQASGRIKSEALAGRSVSLEGGYDPAGSGVLAKYILNGRP
jgi:hypothetical protein